VKTVSDIPKAQPQRPRSETALFRQGQIVAGRYTVLAMIGRGGMGCIYRVHDNALKEDVALKTLLPQMIKDKMVVERFFNEARIARGLSHANIVRVHDIGMARSENGDNLIYISMELVKGQSLRSLLEHLPTGQRLPVKTALRIMDELCSALEYAHSHTVHRDIKPENVMICEDGSVKLMDFGISKLMDRTRLTEASIVMGTPFYMSPEQLKNSANVDARADIYSLGVMLYEILTGNMPTGIPKPASQLTREVPPALDPIVIKCVEHEPKDRYQNAAELRAALLALREVLEPGSTSSVVTAAKRHTAAARTQRPIRRRLGAGILAAVALLTAAGLYALETTRQQSQNKTPFPTNLEGGVQPAIAAELARLKAIAPKLKNVAVPKLNDITRGWTGQGDLRMARAGEAGQTQEALRSAREAVQFYTAAYLSPPDMTFVPPGDISIEDEAGLTGKTLAVDGFLIDVTEVTVEQFVRFCANENWPPRSNYQGAEPDLPVANVTYYDAEAFAAWAQKKLPTEPQWARAAYGSPGASRKYPWGDQWQADAANLGGAEDGTEYLAPVKTFPPDMTGFGCYDMTGNVAEWTRTLFQQPSSDDRSSGADAHPTFNDLMTVRGGSFGDTGRPTLTRRYGVPYETFLPTLGFRCVVELTSLEELERQLQ
jgi:serine/threonine-protein kinase